MTHHLGHLILTMTDWMSAVSVINTVWRHLVISGDKHNADFWNNFKSHFTHFKDNRENLSSHSGHHCEQAEEPFLNKWRNKVSRTKKHLKCFRATEQLFLLERFLFSVSMWKKYVAGFINASDGLLKRVCVCVCVCVCFFQGSVPGGAGTLLASGGVYLLAV